MYSGGKSMMLIKYGAIAVLGISAFIIVISALISRKPLRYLFLNALLGIAAIIAVNLTTRFTGVHIPVNPYTAGAGGILGIPGVCGLILLQMII